MNKIEGKVEAWESGELGRDESFVEVSSIDFDAIDEALELKSISIRMPQGLIDDLKDIGKIHGLGYQPLIKQVLKRFVEAEKKIALRDKARQADVDSVEMHLECEKEHAYG